MGRANCWGDYLGSRRYGSLSMPLGFGIDAEYLEPVGGGVGEVIGGSVGKGVRL
jgi:hypothetical protein